MDVGRNKIKRIKDDGWDLDGHTLFIGCVSVHPLSPLPLGCMFL